MRGAGLDGSGGTLPCRTMRCRLWIARCSASLLSAHQCRMVFPAQRFRCRSIQQGLCDVQARTAYLCFADQSEESADETTRCTDGVSSVERRIRAWGKCTNRLEQARCINAGRKRRIERHETPAALACRQAVEGGFRRHARAACDQDLRAVQPHDLFHRQGSRARGRRRLDAPIRALGEQEIREAARQASAYRCSGGVHPGQAARRSHRRAFSTSF